MIAIDVMGGDYAPRAILEGSLRAAKKSVPVTLYGPLGLIQTQLSELDPSWQSYNITICDTPDVIEMGEEPIQAIRRKSNSSLVKAVASIKEGRNSAVISAGNSGALMAAATFILGRKPGVERVAIAGLMPSPHGRVLALDLGANTDVRPHHLYQFAQLGVDYAQSVLKISNPRVALLSNGHEEGKGSLLVKEAFGLLKTSPFNFVGNVEPYDLLSNKTDIIVCDGFSGNIFLKTMEAVFEFFTKSMKRDLRTAADPTIQQWGRDFLGGIDKQLDHKQVGGALLLGVQGTVIVCHGNSDAQIIENAISFAQKASSEQGIYGAQQGLREAPVSCET
jgi:glycerol-3-phosphate acyltransferase PlsX